MVSVSALFLYFLIFLIILLCSGRLTNQNIDIWRPVIILVCLQTAGLNPTDDTFKDQVLIIYEQQILTFKKQMFDMFALKTT